jgi:DNA-binding NtrC family response regulator
MSNFTVDYHLKMLTIRALQYTDGNRTEASKLLGVSVRTLRNWINKYSLTRSFPPSPRRAARK